MLEYFIHSDTELTIYVLNANLIQSGLEQGLQILSCFDSRVDILEAV